MNNYQSQNQQRGIVDPMTTLIPENQLPQYGYFPVPQVPISRVEVSQVVQGLVDLGKQQVDAANNYTKQMTDELKLQTAAINSDTALVKRRIAQLDEILKSIQVDMAMTADEAFSQIDVHDGKFCVIGKRGQTIVLTDVPLDLCWHILPDEAYGKESYFLIQFKNQKVKVIPSKYLSKPTKLLQALAEAAGKPLKTCSNERRIAGLLAQALAATADCKPYLYRYGWLEIPGGWLFQLCNGKTHCPKLPTNPEELPHTMVLTELDHGASLRSVEQVITMFEIFKLPNIARMLFLWWNASFLFTLLAEGSHADSTSVLPMGLCVQCQGKSPRHCLERIFQWYGDAVISLGDELDQFKRRLGQRKDQPMLIKDDFVSVKNEEILTQALSSGSVPPVGRNDEPLGLRAAVTLLSEGKSVLGFNPNFLSLELTDLDIAQDILPRLPALAAFREDYFRGFAHFSQNNVELLQTLMKEMPTFDCSGSDQDYELSSNGAQVLATLRCVQRFVRAYLDSLAPSEDLARRIRNLLSEDDTFLLELLENSYTVNDNLTHVFLGVAQRKIQDGSIRKIPLRDVVATGTVPDAEDGIVYFDEKYYYFDIKAFRGICRDCRATTRTVLNSIAPLLEGTPYCDGSAMTRIPGVRNRTRAYQISSKYFKRSFVKSKL